MKRLRWPLAIFAAVVLARAWADVTYSPGGHESVAPLLLRGIFHFSWVILAGLLVHEDPLLGVTSYWKTRPVRPRALLGAKSAFAFSFLALGPGMVDVAVLARYGLERAEWGAVLLRSVAEQMAWLTSAGALAAVTWSVPTYLLSIGVAALVWVSMVLGMEQFSFYLGSGGWLQLTLIGAVSSIVLWRQYGRRGAALSITALGAAYALAPWTTFLSVDALLTRALGEAKPLPAEFVEVKTYPKARPDLSIRLGLAEAESGAFFNGDAVDAVFELRDGRTVRVAANTSTFGTRHNSAVALMSAMPGFDWFGIGAGRERVNPVVTLELLENAAPIELLKEPVAIHGVARVKKYVYERAGGVLVRPDAKFSGASMTFRILKVEADDLHIRLKISGSQIFNLGYTGRLVLVDSRRRVASHYEPWIDFGSNWAAQVSRVGLRVGVFDGGLAFLMPRARRSSDLGELELQIWRPVLQGRYAGVIEIEDFEHGSAVGEK